LILEQRLLLNLNPDKFLLEIGILRIFANSAYRYVGKEAIYQKGRYGKQIHSI